MQYGKFTHILALLATVPAPWVVPHVKPEWSGNRAMTREEANATFDHIFEYIHANFAKPAIALNGDYTLNFHAPFSLEGKQEFDDCQAMLLDKNCTVTQFVQFLETIPPHFSEVLFPVCVARYLLRERRIPIHHRGCLQFKEFHERYGRMIVD